MPPAPKRLLCITDDPGAGVEIIDSIGDLFATTTMLAPAGVLAGRATGATFDLVIVLPDVRAPARHDVVVHLHRAGISFENVILPLTARTRLVREAVLLWLGMRWN